MIAGAKEKFNTANTDALLSTLFQYNRPNAVDTVAKPKHAFVTYSLDKISVNRKDAQKVEIISPPSSLYTDTV